MEGHHRSVPPAHHWRRGLPELIRKTSRGKCGPERINRILQAAAYSVGSQRALDGARIAIRSLIAQMEALQPIREKLEAEITALADRLEGYLLTLPGVDALAAVSLFGETDPIEAVRAPPQLAAFAGLDLV